MEQRTALIIGCGIGGPAVAMFLRRAGFEARIYEAQLAPDDHGGYFLNVASNGRDVLKTLGLDDQIAAAGFAAPRMIMWSGSGKRLGEVRNGAAPGHGPTSVIIKRGELHAIVRRAALVEGISIEFGKQLIDLETAGDRGVIARFADGSTATGDFVIGCDGIHSRTRQIIDPHAPRPSFTGLVGCGGFSRSAGIAPTPETQHFVFGTRAFFGYLVKPDGEIYWFANIGHAGEPRRSDLLAVPPSVWQQRLIDLFREDQPFISRIIRASSGELGMYPIYDMPLTPHWHRGRIVLMGDAAHATSPSIGQGASLALEDAIVLAQCIRDIPQIENAFATFERIRRRRAEKIVRYSRTQGNNKVASSPLSRWARDLTLPLILRLLANSQSLNWLYSHRINWADRAARPA